MAELVPIAAPADQAEGTEMVVGTWFKKRGRVRHPERAAARDHHRQGDGGDRGPRHRHPP